MLTNREIVRLYLPGVAWKFCEVFNSFILTKQNRVIVSTVGGGGAGRGINGLYYMATIVRML